MTEQSLHAGDDIRTLNELIAGIKVAMLTTASPEGSLRGRPMVAQATDFDGDLWFYTRADSAKMGEIDREHHVNLAYVDPDTQRYISVSGWASVVRDAQKARHYWQPALRGWFPKGPEDPDVAMLRVHVEHAEYWHTPSGKMAQLAGFMKAVMTGQAKEPGEGHKMEFRPSTTPGPHKGEDVARKSPSEPSPIEKKPGRTGSLAD